MVPLVIPASVVLVGFLQAPGSGKRFGETGDVVRIGRLGLNGLAPRGNGFVRLPGFRTRFAESRKWAPQQAGTRKW